MSDLFWPAFILCLLFGGMGADVRTAPDGRYGAIAFFAFAALCGLYVVVDLVEMT